MAKFVRVCVTRTESTELYISVPDDFNNGDLMGEKYRPEIGRIAVDGADDWGWLNAKVVSVADMDAKEAEKYGCGELKVRDA